MSDVNPAQIKPYWTMAKSYALADNMFPTENSGDFSSHQDLIRGSSAVNSTTSLVDFPTHGPWGCDAQQGTTTPEITSQNKYIQKGPAPCMTYSTLRDLLDAKQVTWEYYVPALYGGTLAGSYWDPFDAIKAVRNSPEWATNISSPETNFFTDVSSGKLPAVSWVSPSDQNSDHAGFAKTEPDRLGCRKSSMPSARASIGSRPRSSSYGKTGADGTITCPRRSWIMPGLAFAFR